MQMIAKKASFNLPSAAYLGQIYDYFLYHPNNVTLKYVILYALGVAAGTLHLL